MRNPYAPKLAHITGPRAFRPAMPKKKGPRWRAFVCFESFYRSNYTRTSPARSLNGDDDGGACALTPTCACLSLLCPGFRGNCLARQLLGPVRRVPREHRRDRRLLHEIVALHAIDEVHVRVVRARVVFEPLLNELESGKPGVVERRVIGRAHRPRPDDARRRDPSPTRSTAGRAPSRRGCPVPRCRGSCRCRCRGCSTRRPCACAGLAVPSPRCRSAPRRTRAIRAGPAPRRPRARRESCAAAAARGS